MKVIKTWATVEFFEGEAYIEASLNYKTKAFYLNHGNNDRNVTFRSDADDNKIKTCIDRAKCVTAALKYINQELFNQQTLNHGK
jgi:hypothetical protein